MSAPGPAGRGAFARIPGYYDRLVERYGHDPRACDYGRAESQAAKFQVLGDVADHRGRRVLDVGCGFADYHGYLRERYGHVEYVGLDLSPRMAEEARRLRAGLDIRVGNVLDAPLEGRFDIVTANGIFYLLDGDAGQTLRELVSRMFQLAEVAVAFNSLSSWAPAQEPGEFYADPLEIIDFCRSLTPWVVLRHDYLPHDFTVYLYRQQGLR